MLTEGMWASSENSKGTDRHRAYTSSPGHRCTRRGADCAPLLAAGLLQRDGLPPSRSRGTAGRRRPACCHAGSHAAVRTPAVAGTSRPGVPDGAAAHAPPCADALNFVTAAAAAGAAAAAADAVYYYCVVNTRAIAVPRRRRSAAFIQQVTHNYTPHSH